MNSRALVVLSLLSSCLAAACTGPSSPAASATATDFNVSTDERQRAEELARGTRDFKAATANAPVYLVDVEVFRDKAAEEERGDTARRLLVTHYAAGSDTAILTRVDLDSGEVAGVETVPHLPVRLSEEEFSSAKQLALEHPQVKSALQGKDVEVEAQLSRTADPDDPQYRHRVVHFLFKTPTGYLDEPGVFVDLTSREVVVEPSGMRRPQ